MLNSFKYTCVHKTSTGCYMCAKYCIFCTIMLLCLHVSCSLMTASLRITGITTLVFIFNVQRHVTHLDEKPSYSYLLQYYSSWHAYM